MPIKLSYCLWNLCMAWFWISGSLILVMVHIVETLFFIASCLKTINSKKYGVDLVCFTSQPTTVIYSSKNGWDGKLIPKTFACVWFIENYLFIWLAWSESLRLLSLHDNKYLRYFKGHHDRFGVSHYSILSFFFFFLSQWTTFTEYIMS